MEFLTLLVQCMSQLIHKNAHTIMPITKIEKDILSSLARVAVVLRICWEKFHMALALTKIYYKVCHFAKYWIPLIFFSESTNLSVSREIPMAQKQFKYTKRACIASILEHVSAAEAGKTLHAKSTIQCASKRLVVLDICNRFPWLGITRKSKISCIRRRGNRCMN